MVIENDDLLVHTFTIKEMDIDIVVGPKSEVLVALPPSGPGTFEYTCEVPGHEDMKGTLVVK